jgi:hypothetical protein
MELSASATFFGTASHIHMLIYNQFQEVESMIQQSPCFEEQRGLERLLSECHGFCRNLQILNAKTEVFISQVFQHLVSAAGGRQDSGELAKIYGQASQPAARFARLLGEMDASSVDCPEI